MLTFTHSLLLHLAGATISPKLNWSNKVELVLGNVVPDFITHLGRSKYQALAHDPGVFKSHTNIGWLGWGALFHILCDNYSTLGTITFEGDYRSQPKNGFIERLAQQVSVNIPLQVPRRRILQCALDILVLRSYKADLVVMLETAANYLSSHFAEIAAQVAYLYYLDPQQLTPGLHRFCQLYGSSFIQEAAREEYRLFPLVRSLLHLSSLTPPPVILEKIHQHPELMALVTSNMHLIQDCWQDWLNATLVAVREFPGLPELW
jgi:hypothetical protein